MAERLNLDVSAAVEEVLRNLELQQRAPAQPGIREGRKLSGEDILDALGLTFTFGEDGRAKLVPKQWDNPTGGEPFRGLMLKLRLN